MVRAVVYDHPEALEDVPTHYCPGCTHGVAHRLIAEVIDELGVREKAVLVAPVGCSVFAYEYFNLDSVEAAHGRAPAMATGIKRVLPDNVVFTYQGDGDLAAIGTAEIIHAAARGEKITTVFINNAIFGMTGGQMAPTSLPGQRTTSSTSGRDVALTGNPIKMTELVAQIEGSAYVVRRSLHNVREIRKAKKAIKTAFLTQMHGLGFAMVELLSACPTNWGFSPPDALQWIEENMVPFYPLGDYKVIDAVKDLNVRE
ncbi:MAG: 2-oxoglutarate oxidoreductase [Anaerolineae bacterium]|nr:2-oxoglutarate oxidoreductase [Anaerolineae bacterium]